MSIKTRYSLVGVTIIAFVALMGLRLFAGSRPQLEVNPSVVDFGDVTFGETVKKTIRLRNRGSGTLIVQAVRSSCACTAAVVGRSAIPPAETGIVEISVRTGELNDGRFDREVSILTNDPSTPEFVVPLFGTAAAEFELSARAVDFGIIPAEGVVAKSVKVTTRDGRDARPLSARSTTPAIRVDSKQNGSTLEVVISVARPGVEGHRLFGNVVITTNSKALRELRIPVRGRL